MSKDRKQLRYLKLVEGRRLCHRCSELVNQADVAGGKYDSPQIGAWSLWQGNLDAELMVVGQDWGTVDAFERFRGVDPPPRWENENCANSNLVKLLAMIGIQIGLPGERQENKVFFTNAVYV